MFTERDADLLEEWVAENVVRFEHERLDVVAGLTAKIPILIRADSPTVQIWQKVDGVWIRQQ